MDLTTPIDITAVNTAVVKHKDILKALDILDVQDVLQDCTGMPGITNSITLGRVTNGQISSKYTGIFLGANNLGKVVPRELKVYPVVAEMADEPERYRRTFITEVQGGLWDKKHPFELWIIQHGIALASNDLREVLFVAKLEHGEGKTKIENAFDSWGAIIDTEKASGAISVDKKNMVATGTIDRTNCGEQLLKIWRKMPKTFRNKKNAVMWISEDMGDDYDDWYKDEHVREVEYDAAGQIYLEGTNKKCKLKRCSAFPEGSQFVLLTTKGNMVYGYDKPGDMKSMKAFNSGNPYLFTAAMKYVFGCQFVSIDPSEFIINDQPLVPVESVSALAEDIFDEEDDIAPVTETGVNGPDGGLPPVDSVTE